MREIARSCFLSPDPHVVGLPRVPVHVPPGHDSGLKAEGELGEVDEALQERDNKTIARLSRNI